ncbi:threonine--tRNA ligase [Butyrivibrio sp. YAB3001]|uniref:threonine--tRNA ligase n=1 Tax=Butyrivibrio sp. YAB3001 TaxID=1520812 RepID=UPI0008F68F6F|nr:threonine--tRNA ligase [Butyrivibrio sp. YAB3001]SFB75812.1 threonyl-tRNA synthetase [Butyrivibrio sp. YAB3001]
MKVLQNNQQVIDLSFDSKEGKKAFWHTSAHVLAQAVKRLYPNAKCAIGPAIENGFYYDFEFDVPFNEENLKAVEDEMRKIVKESLSLSVYEVSRKEALLYMEENGEPYKLEMIKELPKGEKISFYRQGDYAEFCVGPHIANVSAIKAIKLLSVAGAYWRGDEYNKMLTRIYGISFPKASLMEEYLHQLEEAKARDHRKLGKELELFAIMDEGPGLPFYFPKGLVLKNQLIDYWRKIHLREGYQEISTPIMLMKSLWEKSGHWDHYRDNMYVTSVDDMDYAIKPMNCPGGMLVYKSKSHSYREFPIRVGELGIVHRAEKSGTLHGLMRARCFTQDDAHIFMREDQVRQEIQGVIRLIDEVYSRFGFPYEIELSTRPENSIGSDDDWELAINSLKEAVEEMGKPYTINEGDGAFYGPKLDFHVKDSIGRTWQCGTIQLDFQLPQRFDLDYVGEDGERHRPIMLHRVVFGSIDRFIGILIEHYAGKFPVWLSPVQVKILPVSDKFLDYSKEIEKALRAKDIRVELDDRNEKLGYKIREARMDKVPYMLVIGEKEEQGKVVSVRARDAEPDKADLGQMAIDEFVRLVE